MLDEDAIKYYADHPTEFVEDIIGAAPDEDQDQKQQNSVR